MGALWASLATNRSLRAETHYAINHHKCLKYGSSHYAIFRHSEENRGTRLTPVRHYVHFVDAVADDDEELSQRRL